MCAFSDLKQRLRSLQKARQIEASELVWSQWAIEHLPEQSARLCQNPVFGAYGLCKPLILFDRIFEKSTFDTVWRCSRLPTALARASLPLPAAADASVRRSGVVVVDWMRPFSPIEHAEEKPLETELLRDMNSPVAS